jgi:hypothetical protein
MADIVRLSFNQRRPPKLEQIAEALERILGETGCPRCGFDGIDVRLRLEEIVNPAANPQPLPWVATKVAGKVLAG